MATGERPLRFCDICGGLDDHPRHVKQLRGDSTDGVPDEAVISAINANTGATAPIEAIRQLYDETIQVHHMDCGAANGCELCIGTEKENKGLRGQKLIDHLEATRNG